jgi:peptidyl-tRNA hydrolase, PTH1 family
MVLDRLAARWGATFTKEAKWQGEVARSGPHLLLKPLTFMNLSGQSAGAVAKFHRLEPASVVAIYDDKDLPFGQLRLREGGSAGGHNGVKSLLQHLGTEAFPRLRVGIGAATPGGPSLASHVLGKFTDAEWAGLEKALDRATDALNYAARHGWSRAMNEFNRAPTPPSPPPPAAPPPAPL